jgi:hypothetical protein
MRDGAAGGRNERRRGWGFGGKDVYFLGVYLTCGSHAQNFQPREAPEGWHGVAGASIGLKKTPAPSGARRCEPIFAPAPQIAIGAAIGEML